MAIAKGDPQPTRSPALGFSICHPRYATSSTSSVWMTRKNYDIHASAPETSVVIVHRPVSLVSHPATAAPRHWTVGPRHIPTYSDSSTSNHRNCLIRLARTSSTKQTATTFSPQTPATPTRSTSINTTYRPLVISTKNTNTTT
jgi:hypothetical protein